MTTEPVASDDAERKKNRYHFDRHTPEYREQFADVTAEMLDKCPVAWSDTYDGHWVVSGYQEVFDIARRADILSNDHDPKGERRGYQGISIPQNSPTQSGFIEMDPPEQRHYRHCFVAPARRRKVLKQNQKQAKRFLCGPTFHLPKTAVRGL